LNSHPYLFFFFLKKKKIMSQLFFKVNGGPFLDFQMNKILQSSENILVAIIQ
jgi:hypothetical protein